jgi:hypothetical protein
MVRGPAKERRRLIPVWFLPLLIGLVTITAGLFTWRAGQLGSTAAFEDRQSVGQTITQQRQAVEARIGAINDAVAYVGYAADYAEAGAYDQLAAAVEQAGAPELAAGYADDADRLRQSSSRIAAAAGVFGQQSLLTQLASDSDQPLPFDIEKQVRLLEAEATTGVGSPGVPDPDSWAAEADATRSRVRDLRWATLLLLVAVVGLTIAQLTDRTLTRRVGAAFGLGLYVLVVVSTAVSVY